MTLARPAQNGEDGVLLALLREAGGGAAAGDGGGGRRGFFVEIGAGDGTECNGRILREAGWAGLTFDLASPPHPTQQGGPARPGPDGPRRASLLRPCPSARA